MRERLLPPGIVFRGRLFPPDEVAALATAALDALGDVEATTAPLACVLANHPESVALFFALSAGRAPLILLGPDPATWHTDPAIPRGTRLVLTPTLAHLREPAAGLGMLVALVPTPSVLPPARALPFLTCPGLVFFTSGSTGRPRPVYRTTRSLVEGSIALTDTLALPADGGVLSVLPLDRSYGMNNGLMAATVLGRPLGLLERFDHNHVITMCEQDRYAYWAGAPVMADLLTRSRRQTRGVLPPVCCFAGRLPAPLATAFEARVGVPLRQMYGTTETLTIAFDAAPAAEVRADTAGHPLPGVTLRVGDDLRRPELPGVEGRLWVASPWLMEGYGFPPMLDRRSVVDQWWPTPDVCRVDVDGRVTPIGRLDDRVRSGAGHITSPALIVAALEAFPGISDSVVVPVETHTGPVLCALVEASSGLRLNELHAHLIRSLPAPARPRLLDTVAHLPRLSGGRVDRRACIELLTYRLQREAQS